MTTYRELVNQSRRHPEHEERKKALLDFLGGNKGIIWTEITTRFDWANGDESFGHSGLNILFWNCLSPFAIGLLVDLIDSNEITLTTTNLLTYLAGAPHYPSCKPAEKFPTKPFVNMRWLPVCIELCS
jgi:hypothetical protein